MKIICTTSNGYERILRIFVFLFNKNWDSNQKVEIVGYNKPNFNLPDNFDFISLGEQIGDSRNFSNDLRKYFESQDTFFCWIFNDSFIKSIDFEKLDYLWSLRNNSIGRINLCSKAGLLQDHFIHENYSDYKIVENTQTALYRLCTQPSIWHKQFLLKYLTKGLTPWEFETQESKNDGWRIIGLEKDVLIHNEGVTKHDIYKLNLNGIKVEQINEMKQFGIL
jgi:hypothetical protein